MKKQRLKHEDTWLISGGNQNSLPGRANLEPTVFIGDYSVSEINNKYNW